MSGIRPTFNNTSTGTVAAHASSHVPGASDGLTIDPFLQTLMFGSGRDGALTFDGSAAVTIDGVSHSPSGGVYTLTRAVEASSITMSGCTVITVGFAVRCKGTWTCTGTNVIKDDGNAASGATAGGSLQNFTATAGRTATAGGTAHRG